MDSVWALKGSRTFPFQGTRIMSESAVAPVANGTAPTPAATGAAGGAPPAPVVPAAISSMVPVEGVANAYREPTMAERWERAKAKVSGSSDTTTTTATTPANAAPEQTAIPAPEPAAVASAPSVDEYAFIPEQNRLEYREAVKQLQSPVASIRAAAAETVARLAAPQSAPAEAAKADPPEWAKPFDQAKAAQEAEAKAKEMITERVRRQRVVTEQVEDPDTGEVKTIRRPDYDPVTGELRYDEPDWNDPVVAFMLESKQNEILQKMEREHHAKTQDARRKTEFRSAAASMLDGYAARALHMNAPHLAVEAKDNGRTVYDVADANWHRQYKETIKANLIEMERHANAKGFSLYRIMSPTEALSEAAKYAAEDLKAITPKGPAPSTTIPAPAQTTANTQGTQSELDRLRAIVEQAKGGIPPSPTGVVQSAPTQSGPDLSGLNRPPSQIKTPASIRNMIGSADAKTVFDAYRNLVRGPNGNGVTI